jgi:hypothetical protein
MHTSRARRRAGIAAVVIAALLGVGACSSSHSSDAGAAASSAKAAGQSALAENSAAINQAEQLLLANLQKEIKATPAHPYEAAKRAVKDTFPTGDVSAIEQYAVSKASVSMVHSQAARHAWAHLVVTYALTSGGSTASPGSASIPGTTAVPASPSASST